MRHNTVVLPFPTGFNLPTARRGNEDVSNGDGCQETINDAGCDNLVVGVEMIHGDKIASVTMIVAFY